jgi:hypothetical protein
MNGEITTTHHKSTRLLGTQREVWVEIPSIPSMLDTEH